MIRVITPSVDLHKVNELALVCDDCGKTLFANRHLMHEAMTYHAKQCNPGSGHVARIIYPR